MVVYKLEPEERLLGMKAFADHLFVATSHRLFEIEVVEGAGPDKFKIKPILMEAGDGESED